MMDLGAHKGDDSAFYLKDNYKVVALEAHPELTRHCTERFKNDLRMVRVVHGAITPTGEETKLFTSNKGLDGETHSIHPHRVKGCEDVGYTVAGTTVPRLFKAHGVPKYLKIDIEGADITAIRQLHDWAATPGGKLLPAFVSVELCWDHPEEALEIFAHFGYMGYDRFSLEPQTWHRTVDIEAVDHALCLREAAERWFSKGGLPPDIWYDLHAKHKDCG